MRKRKRKRNTVDYTGYENDNSIVLNEILE